MPAQHRPRLEVARYGPKQAKAAEKAAEEEQKRLEELRASTKGSSVLDDFDRKARLSTADEDLRATNPHYSQGPEWQQNCQRCVPAYELRRRGYRVTAKPAVVSAEGAFAPADPLYSRWHTGIFENIRWHSIHSGTGQQVVEKLMASWGDGARAQVMVGWQAGGAHVFVAEQIGGVTHYLDPQNGLEDCSKYFTLCVDGDTMIARIDKLRFTTLIRECVQNGG